MSRLSLGVVAGLFSMLAATQTAMAAPMDFALHRLRIESGQPGCATVGRQWCPDQALFERLMVQFGTAMTLPMGAPAATLGPRGFYLGFDTTATSINRSQPQWTRGSQGEARSSGSFANPDPDGVLVWNRLALRKGLPLGLEVDAFVAQALSTQAWLVGVGMKWAILEGFRTGLGRFPDVAIRGGLATVVGAADSSLTSVSFDLMFSKPYTMQQAWVVTPMLGLQGSWLFADSDLVDLTPEVDAFEQCNARPGHQLPDGTKPAVTIGCLGNSRDYANTVVFESLTHFNLRLSAGAETRYRSFVARVALAFDLLAPTIEAVDPDAPLSRQVSFNVGLGVAF